MRGIVNDSALIVRNDLRIFARGLFGSGIGVVRMLISLLLLSLLYVLMVVAVTGILSRAAYQPQVAHLNFGWAMVFLSSYVLALNSGFTVLYLKKDLEFLFTCQVRRESLVLARYLTVFISSLAIVLLLASVPIISVSMVCEMRFVVNAPVLVVASLIACAFAVLTVCMIVRVIGLRFSQVLIQAMAGAVVLLPALVNMLPGVDPRQMWPRVIEWFGDIYFLKLFSNAAKGDLPSIALLVGIAGVATACSVGLISRKYGKVEGGESVRKCAVEADGNLVCGYKIRTGLVAHFRKDSVSLLRQQGFLPTVSVQVLLFLSMFIMHRGLSDFGLQVFLLAISVASTTEVCHIMCEGEKMWYLFGSNERQKGYALLSKTVISLLAPMVVSLALVVLLSNERNGHGLATYCLCLLFCLSLGCCVVYRRHSFRRGWIESNRTNKRSIADVFLLLVLSITVFSLVYALQRVFLIGAYLFPVLLFGVTLLAFRKLIVKASVS